MNIKRGLLRLWLVLTVLWAGTFTALLWDTFETVNQAFTTYAYDPESHTIVSAGKPWEYPRYTSTHTLREFANGVRLYVPDSASEEEIGAVLPAFLEEKVATAVGEHRSWNWTGMTRAAQIALIPPLVVLIVGAAFWWAAAGFRARRPDQ